MIDLDRLEQISRSATPGPWWIDSHGHEMVNCETLELIFMTSNDMGEALRHEDTGNLSRWRNDNDATFIAALDPTVAIELITRLRETEKDAARYRWLVDNSVFGMKQNGVSWSLSFDGPAPEYSGKIGECIDQAIKEKGDE